MPPFSKNLAEEGVLIRNFKLVDAGQSRLDELRRLLLSGPYPTRNVARQSGRRRRPGGRQRQGARELQRWSSATRCRSSRPTCGTSRPRPSGRCGWRWPRCRDGGYEFVDHLDDGSPIAVAITIDGRLAPTIDFTGTGPVLPGNLNANRAIVTAAVMYCAAAV